MSISLILIIVSSVGFVIAFASILFAKRKKKAPKAKVEPVVAQEKSAESQKDDNFKISRKNKGARVSKKALDTDSRTATVEPVFKKEHKEETTKEVDVESLSRTDDDLIDAISKLDKEERKVVSLGALVGSVVTDAKSEPARGKEQPKRFGRGPIQEEPDVDDFDKMGFLANLRKDSARPEPPKIDDKDFSDVVEMDAILNPKFKNDKK